MTLSRISVSNVRGMARKYAAFIATSTLAVLVFYLFASFVMHPDAANNHYAQTQLVRSGLLVSEYIIVSFTFFFILYSSSAFIRARKKEFGLLALLGATKSQMSRIIVTEHVLIGLFGILSGLGLGIPLSKVMLGIMSRMLKVTSPIRFMVVVPAVLWTAGLFFILFIAIGVITTLQISPRQVVSLLREHQRPKAYPRYSGLVALLSLILVGGGYWVAWSVDGRTLVPAMLPVTAVVSLGTFLFFAQASIGILTALRKKTSFLYRNLNLLTVGDLVFRMRENARVLASVAVLSACVITAVATIYTAQAVLLMDMETVYGHALTIAVRGETDPVHIVPRIREILDDESLKVTEEVVLRGLIGFSEGNRRTLVIPETSFNEWLESSGTNVPEVFLGPDDAAQLSAAVLEPSSDAFTMEITYGDLSRNVNCRLWPFLRVNYPSAVTRFLVVDDSLFDSLAGGARDEDLVVFASYEFENWRGSLVATTRALSSLKGRVLDYTSRAEAYEDMRRKLALTAMIGIFVTVLFFIAAGSTLYFRLFSEIEEDREKYGIMEKLGISKEEIGTVISRQLLVFFFAPIAVGSLHCAFAMKALSNVLAGVPWPFMGVYRYALASMAGFAAIQVVYFVAARRAYVREVFRPSAA
ncbi:MAG TPA: ABC transporter permease [Firmicutes bacterium]|nr:ABC transporter permease [Candidatus Fermentithermobacillaceae bacterium]